MATVEWTNDGTVSGKIVITWAALTGSDDGAVVTPQAARSLAGCIQFIGTFGGGSVTLQKSNDGVTWATVKDFPAGNDIAPAAPGIFEFSTAAMKLRLLAAGVTSVSAIMVLRG